MVCCQGLFSCVYFTNDEYYDQYTYLTNQLKNQCQSEIHSPTRQRKFFIKKQYQKFRKNSDSTTSSGETRESQHQQLLSLYHKNTSNVAPTSTSSAPVHRRNKFNNMQKFHVNKNKFRDKGLDKHHTKSFLLQQNIEDSSNLSIKPNKRHHQHECIK